MRNGAVVKINSVQGKLIGLTSDYFLSGVVWSALPRGFYFNALYSVPGREKESFEQLLANLKKLALLGKFTAPSAWQVAILIKYGYRGYIDEAGTPNWVNLSDLGISRICENSSKVAIQITPQLVALCNESSVEDYLSPDYSKTQQIQSGEEHSL